MGLRLKLYSYKEFNNKNEMKKQKRKKNWLIPIEIHFKDFQNVLTSKNSKYIK